MNRAFRDAVRARQAELLAERQPGQPYPSMRKLGAYGPPLEKRMVFLSKGVGVAGDPPRYITNPGFPYTKPGNAWWSGGLPLGMSRKDALDYVKAQTSQGEEE